MKQTTKTAPGRNADSSLDATLNPVELGSNEVVSWAIAFPRPGSCFSGQTSMWRTDATIGAVVGVASRMPAVR
jgi:hypothetical protein